MKILICLGDDRYRWPKKDQVSFVFGPIKTKSVDSFHVKTFEDAKEL